MIRTSVLLVGCMVLGACATNPVEDVATDENALHADAPSSIGSLPLLEVPQNDACPTSISVGTRGDSFIGGVRKTFDIKELIAEGEKLEHSRVVDTGDEVVVWYGANLRADIASCSGRTATYEMYNDLSWYRVTLEDGRILVELKVHTHSLDLTVTSSFANQAIFEVYEQP